MGISQSTLNLTQSEVDEVHKYCDSILTAGEIESLYRRFRSLDKSHKGFLGAEELVRIPEVALNPLSHRLCVILDGSNFKEFCEQRSVNTIATCCTHADEGCMTTAPLVREALFSRKLSKAGFRLYQKQIRRSILIGMTNRKRLTRSTESFNAQFQSTNRLSTIS